MDLSEWSLDDQRIVFIELPYDRIDLTHFKDLLEFKGGKDALQGFAEHRLSAPGSADHDDVVQSGGCNC